NQLILLWFCGLGRVDEPRSTSLKIQVATTNCSYVQRTTELAYPILDSAHYAIAYVGTTEN
ncbi:MAG: hypothetical protein ACRD19_07915, partial [Terriglobia bacterium]